MKLYRTFNLVVLGFLLYALVFPLVSPLFDSLFHVGTRCYYLAFTGRPCPFCGLTRDMNSLMVGDSGHDPLNPRFYFFFYSYIVEFVLRLFFLFVSLRATGKLLPVIDAVVHSSFLFVFLFVLHPM